MQQLQVFNFENKTIRTQLDNNGAPWWAIKDICAALGLSNVTMTSSRLDEDEHRVFSFTEDTGRNKEMAFVNESGLYSLIIRSNKEEAKRFKKWITSEVLPSIRKTGSYSSDFAMTKLVPLYRASAEILESSKKVAELFGLSGNQALLYANKATTRATGLNYQEVLGIELKVEDQERCFTPTDLGQRCGMSAVRFNKTLESFGLQEKKNDTWCATEAGKKYSVLMDAGKKHSDGTPIQQLKWKESVLSFFTIANQASA